MYPHHWQLKTNCMMLINVYCSVPKNKSLRRHASQTGVFYPGTQEGLSRIKPKFLLYSCKTGTFGLPTYCGKVYKNNPLPPPLSLTRTHARTSEPDSQRENEIFCVNLQTLHKISMNMVKRFHVCIQEDGGRFQNVWSIITYCTYMIYIIL
jgi:hypothetical protein